MSCNQYLQSHSVISKFVCMKYSYYQTICKQLSECVNKENQCGKRVFAIMSQWLAIDSWSAAAHSRICYLLQNQTAFVKPIAITPCPRSRLSFRNLSMKGTESHPMDG